MNLDPTNLLLSMLFGTIGFGFFQFGRKNARWVPLGVGIALMVVPYFLPNATWMTAVCVTLCAVPAVVPEFS